MIIVLKKGATQQDIDKLTNLVTAHGVQVNPVIGTELTILGLVGDTSQVDPNRIESFPCVERVMHVAGALQKGQPHVPPRGYRGGRGRGARSGGKQPGGDGRPLLRGEPRSRSRSMAQAVKARPGANILRGGAFKPRTSPYAFQGLEYRGAGAAVRGPGRPPACPSSPRSCPPLTWMLFEEKVDVIQVGARNMQNFDLLQASWASMPQAHPAQAGPVRHHRGVAHERRVHHGRRATPT